MTYPLPITTVRPGPTGSARAGALTGFNNLGLDLDTNFTAIKNWATSVRDQLDPMVYTSGWITPASGWALSLAAAGVDVIFKRLGRLVWANLGFTYTGNIVSSATGDTSPDILMGTITNAAIRPIVATQISMTGYVNGFVMASVTVGVNGTLTLTGLSAAITLTNPGFCATASWFGP